MSFSVGVYEIHPVNDSEDLVVFGRVNGTVKIGTAAVLSNMGADNETPFSTAIVGIEISENDGWKSVTEATDCFAFFKLNKAAAAKVRIATVLHDFEATYKQKHDTYINTLGDCVVVNGNMKLSSEEMNEFTFTDICELVRLYDLYHTEIKPDSTEEEKKETATMKDALALYACSRLLALEDLYIIGSKHTGEPFIFSRSVVKDKELVCTPPVIRVFTKAYLDNYRLSFNDEDYMFFKVENGTEKQGIKKFLLSQFMENGVWGVELLNEDVTVKAELIVAPPDYTGKKREEVPICNPNLVRWMLLMGQMPAPETDEAKTIFKAYYKFFSDELPKAHLIVPIQKDGSNDKSGSQRGVSVNQGRKLVPAIQPSVGNGRDAVKMFTDLRRLGMMFDNNEWTAMVTNVSGVIGKYDCLINATQHVKGSFYLSKELYDEMNK